MALASRRMAWCGVSILGAGIEGSRAYSRLPRDIAHAARRANYPTKRVTNVPPPVTPGQRGGGPGAAANSGQSMAEMQQQSAQIATAWMFPWERRQMAGGKKLTTWEKIYWGAFAGGMSLLAFNHLRPKTKKEVEVDEEKEAAKAELARSVLAGKSMITDEDDLFEGLTPKEIQEYVESAAGGATLGDPFEGMSPEEINAYVEKHGAPSGP